MLSNNVDDVEKVLDAAAGRSIRGVIIYHRHHVHKFRWHSDSGKNTKAVHATDLIEVLGQLEYNQTNLN